MDNSQHVAGFIGNVLDDVLCDDLKHSIYPDVILPFTVLARIDLAPTRENVLKVYAGLKDDIQNPDGILKHESGYTFYNTSRYDFRRLLDDPKNIYEDLIDCKTPIALMSGKQMVSLYIEHDIGVLRTNYDLIDLEEDEE